ncbi:hypothetical protein HOF65_06335 [bacterium]|nr:hypothetical protein [bacterium]MBT3853546.1 hypothetical protein [bacterium]MBT4633688.1 hypothetical protein [bacterium]MBT6779037.1 hypothetical protein [bacterium]
MNSISEYCLVIIGFFLEINNSFHSKSLSDKYVIQLVIIISQTYQYISSKLSKDKKLSIHGVTLLNSNISA